MIQSPQRSAPSAAVMTSPYDLNLRHLRGLLAVEEHGSISTAAQAISLSQPALTQGILKLETQLGEVLFDRRSDGMVPTTAGKLVLDRARACMRHLTTGGALGDARQFRSGPPPDHDAVACLPGVIPVG